MMYFANKGLFIRKLEGGNYVIQDVFGTCSLPFQSSVEELDEKTHAIANIHKLVTVGQDSKFPDLSDFKWDALEYYYVAHIEYAFIACLLSDEEVARYHTIVGFFPVGYVDCGYGEGSKSTLEAIHSHFSTMCRDEKSLIQERELELHLIIKQINRICSDIMSLINRAISAYTELLRCQRECILHSYEAIEGLEANELIHRGHDSYKVASAVTSLVISLCSSLDLSAKLTQYINSIDATNYSFKSARDKQYHDLKKIKSKLISEEVLCNIVRIQEAQTVIPEIIQFRNDLIHSTSAVELEKIYVGIGTEEINKHPLYYSAQYARDCLDTGQPVRYMGRNYFVADGIDIEVRSLLWIREIIDYHLDVAKELYSYLQTIKIS